MVVKSAASKVAQTCNGHDACASLPHHPLALVLLGGTLQISEKLAAGLPDGTLQLNSPVLRIEKQHDDYHIIYGDGRLKTCRCVHVPFWNAKRGWGCCEVEVLDCWSCLTTRAMARRVILALAPSQIGKIEFAPALPAWRQHAYSTLKMGGLGLNGTLESGWRRS